MFQTQLSDLDELILKCRSPQAQNYLRDAVLSYKAGAYRVCIVATWIAVVFDFIEKIRELMISGNADAKQWIDSYENTQAEFDRGNLQKISTLLKYENNILIDARDKFLLISHYEFIDLKRLQDDRNRCAHPTFQKIEIPYTPSAEQARCHMRNAVAFVLSCSPVQGKYALASLTQLVESKYFPQNIDDASKLLAESPFFNPSKSLSHAFIDYLIFGYFNKESKLFMNNNAIYALKASMKNHKLITYERFIVDISKIISNTDDSYFKNVVLIVCTTENAYEDLQESHKIKIKEYCKTCTYEDLYSIFSRAYQINDLMPILSERISNLDEIQLSHVYRWTEFPVCINHAVKLFCTSRSYILANRIYETLIDKIIDILNNEQIETILNSPTDQNSDLIGSYALKKFINALITNKRYSTTEITEKLKDPKHEEKYLYLIDDFEPEPTTIIDDEIPF